MMPIFSEAERDYLEGLGSWMKKRDQTRRDAKAAMKAKRAALALRKVDQIKAAPKPLKGVTTPKASGGLRRARTLGGYSALGAR